jgi:hypothetical protein
MNLEDLKRQFEPSDIEFRAGATNKDKTSALALPYITSRAVMDRLDTVVGPENWRDEYRPGPDGGVLCGLSIRIDGEWLTKWDGAENTAYEPVKGGLSDSFKRSAVKWGIGRYLYSLPAVWVKATAYGNTVKIDEAEARAKVFGQAQRSQASATTAPAFGTLNELLGGLVKEYGVNAEVAKQALKTAGYNSFKKSQAGAMYQAAAAVLQS